MSVLTSEEREFVAQWDDGSIMGFTIADGERLIDLVRRLSARVEELERERASCEVWTNYHNTNINNVKLRDNLSSLLSAVEPIVERLTYFEKDIHIFPEDTKATLPIPFTQLRNLDQVVKEIKGVVPQR